jgi:hypothetical protein
MGFRGDIEKGRQPLARHDEMVAPNGAFETGLGAARSTSTATRVGRLGQGRRIVR